MANVSATANSRSLLLHPLNMLLSYPNIRSIALTIGTLLDGVLGTQSGRSQTTAHLFVREVERIVIQGAIHGVALALMMVVVFGALALWFYRYVSADDRSKDESQ